MTFNEQQRINQMLRQQIRSMARGGPTSSSVATPSKGSITSPKMTKDELMENIKKYKASKSILQFEKQAYIGKDDSKEDLENN